MTGGAELRDAGNLNRVTEKREKPAVYAGRIKDGSAAMNTEKEKVCAIVLAAGRGKRMGSEIPKQFLNLGGYPVLYYCLRAFEESDADEVILVTGEADVDYCRREIADRYQLTKVKAVITGGAERYESVERGLEAAQECQYVLIHDGARPALTPALINENIASVKKYGACVTAVPSKDTVKLSDQDGFVRATPSRSSVWIIQTPQSFAYELVKAAYDRRALANDAAVTDDAMVVEKYTDHPVKLLMGDYRNIKLTTPEDLAVMEVFLKNL